MAESPDTPPTDAPLALLIDLLAGRAGDGRALGAGAWDEFVRLAIDRHRVAALVLDAAGRQGVPLPQPVEARLAAAAQDCAADALRQKAECHRLLPALEGAGCRPAVLKGWPLAEALYGSAALRHAKDLDLWVAPDEVDACLPVLERLGYRLDEEHAARAPLMRQRGFRAEFNDLAFWCPERGVQVELHWRSQHFRGWPELGAMPGAWEERSLDGTGVRVRVPTARANLVYLAQHGQQHLWQRLKWLVDVARLLASRSEDELTGDLAAARAIGGARPAVIAGHLAREVLGAPLPRSWPAAGAIEARAVRFFRRAIAAPDPVPGTLSARLGYYGGALALGETMAQRAGVLRYGLWRRLRYPGVA